MLETTIAGSLPKRHPAPEGSRPSNHLANPDHTCMVRNGLFAGGRWIRTSGSARDDHDFWAFVFLIPLKLFAFLSKRPMGSSQRHKFACDSSLEEAGFELSVPPERKAALDRVRRPSVTRRQA